jgi:hypothetical protein
MNARTKPKRKEDVKDLQHDKAIAMATPPLRLLSAPGFGRMAGLTIIQLMVMLLIAGIAGALVVEFIIDKRCEDNPPVKLCMERKVAG